MITLVTSLVRRRENRPREAAAAAAAAVGVARPVASAAARHLFVRVFVCAEVRATRERESGLQVKPVRAQAGFGGRQRSGLAASEIQRETSEFIHLSATDESRAQLGHGRLRTNRSDETRRELRRRR